MCYILIYFLFSYVPIPSLSHQTKNTTTKTQGSRLLLLYKTNLLLFGFFWGSSAIVVEQTLLQLFLCDFQQFPMNFHQIIVQIESFSGGLSLLPFSAYFRRPCLLLPRCDVACTSGGTGASRASQHRKP